MYIKIEIHADDKNNEKGRRRRGRGGV